MTFTNDQLINLVIQAPLVGLVVLIVVIFLRFLKEMLKDMVDFIGQQAAVNREFLTAQREQTAAALARINEEMKLVRMELASNKGREEVIDKIVQKVIKA